MPAERLLDLRTLRRLAWHARHGGISRARTFLRRHRLGINDGGSNRTRWKSHRAQENPPLSGLAGRQSSDTPAGYTLDFLPAEPSRKKPMFPDLTVAVILDQFSETAWGHEFSILSVTPESWKEQLESSRPDLLLVESAWAGNNGAWRYQLTGSKAPSLSLRELVAHCRSIGVPTIFWNKEDPPHFQDFLDTAKIFDVVLTSDSRLIPDYRKELGHHRVYPLSFAAQPAVHNPIRPQHGFHDRDVAFAGMYFAHKFPERRQQMQLLLRAAQSVAPRMTRGLEIFSRFVGDDERYQFPEPFDRHVVGGLEYAKMLTAYKAFKVFLNVNSVTDSPSMCARRVFEITACGTPVISTPSAAIPQFFSPDQVPLVESEEKAKHTIRALVRSPELNNRTAHLGQREIWRHHTYADRAAEVLTAAGLERDSQGRRFGDRLALPPVSAIISTNRPYRLDDAIDTLARFEDVNLEAVLVTHGFEASAQIRERARMVGLENITVLEAPAAWPLGWCLNEAVKAASGEILTKIDDDDLYGPQYLADLLRAMRFSGADLVGKQAHYMHLTSQEATLLRFEEREHRWTDFVMGPTITASRSLFREIPFGGLSRGEDSDFLRRVGREGARIYSADRYNFCQVRHGSENRHAWSVDDAELLATGEVKMFGIPRQHIFL